LKDYGLGDVRPRRLFERGWAFEKVEMDAGCKKIKFLIVLGGMIGQAGNFSRGGEDCARQV